MHVCACLLLFLLPSSISAGSAPIVYRERDGDSSTVSIFSVSRTANGWSVMVRSVKGGDSTAEELRCDAAFNVADWHYRSNRKSDLTLRRNGRRIDVSGTLSGKRVDRALAIDSRPWCQIIPMALAACPADSLARRSFWAVSLRGMAPLRAVAFRVAGVVDTVQPGNPGVACRRIRVKLDGALGRFWDGYYYVRIRDSAFVSSIGYTFGSGKPSGGIEVERGMGEGEERSGREESTVIAPVRR